MTEADEIALNIVASGYRARSRDEALLLTTRFMGTPREIGYQLHDNIADAIEKWSPTA